LQASYSINVYLKKEHIKSESTHTIEYFDNIVCPCYNFPPQKYDALAHLAAGYATLTVKGPI
jgi:hypothetical protein